jgi:3-phosphoshikimate 1-carboxyvinyltransferase
LNLKSEQADKEIIKVLKKLGGSVKLKRDSILAEKSELKAIKFNVKDCPDLFPIISILAAVAKRKSEILGVERLKLKESNRLEEMRRGLNKMGIRAYQEKNRFFIEGGKLKGGMIDSKDHRIVMAFSILGLVAEGETVIKYPESVSKSFPQFFDLFNKIRNWPKKFL